MHMCIHNICVYMCMCITSMDICVYIRIYIYNVCICVYNVCMYVYAYAHVCMYMYMYICRYIIYIQVNGHQIPTLIFCLFYFLSTLKSVKL